MKLFSKLFSRKNKKKEDNFSSIVDDFIKTGKELQDASINEIQERHDAAAALGKLPAPNIAADYKCECGSNNTIHLRKMNLEYGHNVHCAHCGAVLHIPPTILNHSEYWPQMEGASLVENWRDQLKFIEHGTHTSILDKNKIEESQLGPQNDLKKKDFSTWRKIKVGNFDSLKSLKKALSRSKYDISKYVIEMLDDRSFILSSKEEELELVSATVEELGFTSNTRCDDLFRRIKELGYNLCPAEVGPQLRLQYPDQESGRHLVVAMEPLTDSEGDRYIFFVTHFQKKKPGLKLSPFYWKSNPGFVQFDSDRIVFLNSK